MVRAVVASLIVFAGAGAVQAAGVTQAQVDAWLASSPQIVRTTERVMGETRERVEVSGANGGYVFPGEARRGVLAEGQPVMIVLLPSGGSGGVFTTLLFTQRSGRTRFVGYVPSAGGHLDVTLDHGTLLIRTPVYGPGDANCCPSKLHYERATLRGLRLVTLKTWDGPVPRR